MVSKILVIALEDLINFYKFSHLLTIKHPDNNEKAPSSPRPFLDKNIQSFVLPQLSETSTDETIVSSLRCQPDCRRIKTEADDSAPWGATAFLWCLPPISPLQFQSSGSLTRERRNSYHSLSIENLAQFPLSFHICMTSNVRIIPLRNNRLKVFPYSLGVLKNLEF